MEIGSPFSNGNINEYSILLSNKKINSQLLPVLALVFFSLGRIISRNDIQLEQAKNY